MNIKHSSELRALYLKFFQSKGHAVIPGASVIPEKMLVLCGFGQRKLEEMLNQFRKAKIPPIPMKAVLTEHNSGWSLVELYQELRQEHEKMNAADGRGAAENTDGAADSRD